jgi:hypothetical protein
VFVEESVEVIVSMGVRVGDRGLVGDWLGERAQWSGVGDAAMGSVRVVVPLILAAERGAGASGSVFPNPDALLRLAGAVLVEAHDEWQTGDRRYLAEGTMALLTTPPASAAAELVAA